jgi:hypothetical protein
MYNNRHRQSGSQAFDMLEWRLSCHQLDAALGGQFLWVEDFVYARFINYERTNGEGVLRRFLNLNFIWEDKFFSSHKRWHGEWDAFVLGYLYTQTPSGHGMTMAKTLLAVFFF